MGNKVQVRAVMMTCMILLAAGSRLIPHMPNFAPMAAMALFGAAHFEKRWQAFLIPILAVWLSDLVLNNVVYAAYYPTFTWFYSGFYWQYGTYLLIALGGLGWLRRITPVRVVGAALGSSLVFFLITNFGCWLGSSFYAQNSAGLMACYAAGLPFLRGTLLGDLFYTVTMFGGYYLMARRWTILRPDRIQYGFL